MAELLTAAQMGVIEQAAIDSGRVTGLELMERAGRGVVAAVFEQWPELALAPHRAVVLCGPGNNGGDGFVIARMLRDHGWQVAVYLLGTYGKLPPDARANADLWAQTGRIAPLKADTDPLDTQPALVVDALFGTGLSRPVEGAGPLFADLRQGSAWVVSVDLPSGLCGDSGRVLTPATSDHSDAFCIRSDLTVTFHSGKTGHYLASGPALCGRLCVADIGLNTDDAISQAALDTLRASPNSVSGDVVRLVGQGAGRAVPEMLGKMSDAHKYSHGHALVLSGGAGRTGAARLCARAALRIGAGLVTLGVPPSAQQEVACQITALMLRRIDGGESLAEVLGDRRINALCLGPGLGLSRARDLVPAALAATRARAFDATDPDQGLHGGCVLDADALTAFADAPEDLFGLLHGRCVLTPHGGEFARLFPDLAARLDGPCNKGPAWSKIDATRAAARRAGCVVLFKGPDTVIAAPDGRCSITSAQYECAAPWLATAGAGDVLAGFIAGLLARGLAPVVAAEAAAWMHVECARAFGPGLIAEDLPEMVPHVLRARTTAPDGRRL